MIFYAVDLPILNVYMNYLGSATHALRHSVKKHERQLAS